MFVLSAVSVNRIQIARWGLQRKELVVEKKLSLRDTLGRSFGGRERVVASKTADVLSALEELDKGDTSEAENGIQLFATNIELVLMGSSVAASTQQGWLSGAGTAAPPIPTRSVANDDRIGRIGRRLAYLHEDINALW